MIAGILGARGCGKSTLFKCFVHSNPRVIVLDPLGEHGALGIVVSSTAELRAYWRKRWSKRWRIILQPHEVDRRPGARPPPSEALEPYLALIAEHAKRCLIAVDEVGHFGDAWKCDPRLEMLAHYGRHRGVSLVWCARRPQEVPKVLRSQADHLYIFRTTEPSDLNQLRERIGTQAAGALVTLRERTALLWRPGEPPKYVRTELYE